MLCCCLLHLSLCHVWFGLHIIIMSKLDLNIGRFWKELDIFRYCDLNMEHEIHSYSLDRFI